MPEFNRTYTYGAGRFLYKVVFEGGSVSVVCITNAVKVRSADAVRYHLTEVTAQATFRYID